MKAQVLHGIGDIRYEETDKPRIEKDWVLVKVKAAGVCGSDIPRIYKTGAHVHPIATGHEFSGEVIETADDNFSWRGKRVGIFPLIPCGECINCKKKMYEMCSNYNYLGSRCNGGFAEYAAVPEWNLIELPDNVSYKQAATNGCCSACNEKILYRKGFICVCYRTGNNRTSAYDVS